MANQALYDEAEFRVPNHILVDIRQALARAPQAPGHERARNLLQKPLISYSAAKAIKNALEQPEASQHPSFELAGGHGMRAWISGELDRARQSVVRSKTVRTNAGLENQFLTSHEKNGLNTAHSSASGTSKQTRRLELYEQTMSAPSFTADAKKVADALITAFPTLSFEKSVDTGEVKIMAGALVITIASAVGGPETPVPSSEQLQEGGDEGDVTLLTQQVHKHSPEARVVWHAAFGGAREGYIVHDKASKPLTEPMPSKTAALQNALQQYSGK